MKKKFKLTHLRDEETGVIYLNNFDSVLKNIEIALEDLKPFVITDTEGLKEAKKQRATLNKYAKAVSDTRIKTVREITDVYEAQMKEITKVFKDKSKEFDTNIKEYEESVKPKEFLPPIYTATLTYTDPTISEQLEQFCLEKGIKLSIKEK